MISGLIIIISHIWVFHNYTKLAVLVLKPYEGHNKKKFNKTVGSSEMITGDFLYVIWCSPDWTNVPSVNWGTFNLTLADAPIAFLDSYSLCKLSLLTFEFFTLGLFDAFSVRLSDRSKVTQNKINFVKNCPQWDLNSQPPDHQSHALVTELGRNLLEMSGVSFLLFHAPLHMLDFVYF